MASYFCKMVSHEIQPITFVMQSYGKWEFCCGMCQFRSGYGKSNFVPIEDLETIFQDIKRKLIESNVVEILQESLLKVKEWHSQIEKVIDSITNDLITKIELYQHYLFLTEQNIDYFIKEKTSLNSIMDLQNGCDKQTSQTQQQLIKLDEFLVQQLDHLKNHPLSQNQVVEKVVVPIIQPNSIKEVQNIKIEKVNEQEVMNDNQQNQNQKPNIIAIKPVQNSGNQKETKQSDQKENQKLLKLQEGIYEGDIQDGIPHGEGTMKFHNNQIYKGSWKQGKFNGNGVLTISQDESYEGEFCNGKKQGKGKLTLKKGKTTIIFDGFFEQNLKSGQGKEISIEISSFDEPADLTASIFKQALNQNNSIEKKMILEGEFQNNQKQAVFMKSMYENNKLKSQKYCWYENDEYQFDIDN